MAALLLRAYALSVPRYRSLPAATTTSREGKVSRRSRWMSAASDLISTSRLADDLVESTATSAERLSTHRRSRTIASARTKKLSGIGREWLPGEEYPA